MINIGITTYNRKDFLEQCIDSIIENTVVDHKLFVYDDGSNDGTSDMIRKKYKGKVVGKMVLLTVPERGGIVPGFNALWTKSESTNDFPYFCYLQDDVVVTEKGWLKRLVGCYESTEQHPKKFGLFSGHDAPEHPMEDEAIINNERVLIKKSMRATNMIAPYTFWNKIGKIPLINPDGSTRGFPGPPKADGSRGRGSNMDVYITGFQSRGVFVQGAAGKNCSWNLGTHCMVIPGLIKHTAVSKADSTWANPNKE